MKLISLNLWGGRIKEPLQSFLKKHKGSVDIFCFQEMYHSAEGKFSNVAWVDQGIESELFGKISQILSEYQNFFYPHFEDFWGLSMFVKNNISLLKEGEVFVHHTESIVEARKGATSKNIQYVTFEHKGKIINIVNFHGLWNGKGKTDSDSRISQSEKIVAFLGSLSGEIILCGDFNLKPDTQSLKIIEDFGFRNLIKENKITSTRTSLYPREEKFADYMLVTGGINVTNFQVLPDEVSDHNAMFLEFNLK